MTLRTTDRLRCLLAIGIFSSPMTLKNEHLLPKWVDAVVFILGNQALNSHDNDWASVDEYDGCPVLEKFLCDDNNTLEKTLQIIASKYQSLTYYFGYLDIKERFEISLSTSSVEEGLTQVSRIPLFSVESPDGNICYSSGPNTGISLCRYLHNIGMKGLDNCNFLADKYNVDPDDRNNQCMIVRHCDLDTSRLSFRLGSVYRLGKGYSSYEEKYLGVNLKEMAKNRLEKISRVLMNCLPSTNMSLYSGSSGLVLFFANRYLNTGEDSFLDKAFDLLDLVQLNNVGSYSFSSGYAGFLWLIGFLQRKGLVELEDGYFDSIDHILKDEMKRQLRRKEIDQLHGAISVGRYFLSRGMAEECGILVNNLYEMMEKEKQEFKLISVNPVTGVRKYDFGLAHGMAGILYYVIRCLESGIEVEICDTMIRNIISFYRHNTQNFESVGCYYPSQIREKDYGSAIQTKSRMAWCYGDLSILFIILRAALAINDVSLYRDVLEKLVKTGERISFNDTGVIDARLCHGSAGVMHIFHRLYTMTNDDVFRRAQDYWLKVTLVMGNVTTNQSGYLFQMDNNRTWAEDLSLLDGIAGVGVALESYLSSCDEDWDECIMLT